MTALTPETAERVLPIRSLSNDLFADFICGWPDGSKCRGLIRLSGYNDHYFFAHVNTENRPAIACPVCGRQWVYRWTVNGVLIAAEPA
jgi:hypothetical protein